MRKYIFILFVGFLFPIGTSAQFNFYYPFPDSNANWNVTYVIYYDPPTCEWSYDYFLNGDTTIGGNLYSKIYVDSGNWDCRPAHGSINTIRYKCAMREDNNKHIYVNNGSGDILYYDFNLNIGDTLTQYIGEGLVVESIDSILIGNTYRKQFYLPTHYGSLIEGIGSTQGLLEQMGFVGVSNYGMLNCFSQNGATLYPDSSTKCGLFLGVANIEESTSSFSVYPNPASTHVKLDIILPQGTNEGILELYNSIGKVIKSIPLNTNTVNLTENISYLTNGIYYYKLVANNSMVSV